MNHPHLSEGVAMSSDPSTATDSPDTTPVAVVTGASSGIGRSLAHQFVEHGYDVVVAAEDPAIEEAALELRATGRRVTAVQADLATPAGVHARDGAGGP